MKRIAVCLVVSYLTFISRASEQGGIITTIAGTGASLGDGGPATYAQLYPYGIVVDGSGNIIIADSGNNRIRKITPNGIITTIAGNGTKGFLGDNGPATSAELSSPVGVTMDGFGNLFFADNGNNRIRKVSASGVITTIAGNGTNGYSGDDGPAVSAKLATSYATSSSNGVAVDASGNVLFADTNNQRIRMISPDGIITTFAGNGSAGFFGDGGPATSAKLNEPLGIAVDASGNVLIADTSNNRVRQVSPSGIITTIAGNGTSDFSGDNEPATAAALAGPISVAVDASGNLFIADYHNARIRKVSAGGIITTVAGNGTFENGSAPNGDGGPATSAPVYQPYEVAVDGSGNILIAEYYWIREVTAPAPVTAPSISMVAPFGSTTPTIQPGEWVSIYGANLASSTVNWKNDFPMSLGGTSVTIDGNPAYLSMVSPGQINLQAPDDTASGPVPVVVTTAIGNGAANVTLSQFGPSFFLADASYVSGTISRSEGSGAYGGGAYDMLGPTGTSLGYPTIAAAPGDTVQLLATGLGPTNPTVPAGHAFSGSAPTTNPVTLLINNVSVTPTFAGLSGAGQYQINLTIPAGLGVGDVPLVASVGGAQTPSSVVISLQDTTTAGCANIGGTWSVAEKGSLTETVVATVETDSGTAPINATGDATILQTGCSIQYNPISETGLIGTNLSQSQVASLARTGSVTGNTVSVSGLLALVDTVASAKAGFTVAEVSTNVETATGHLAGSVLTLNGTGTFVASGTYSISGQTGSFTETITTSTTATFNLLSSAGTQGGILTTVAGNGGGVFSGDGGPATSATLQGARGVAVDASGNVYIADYGNYRVRKVSPSGIITTFAGNGTRGSSGDGGPATSATLLSPVNVTVDASGNVFIADWYMVRKVSPDGIISTVGGIPTNANPVAIAVDNSGNVFFADYYWNVIRKVPPGGVATIVAGGGSSILGDGGPATSAMLAGPNGVAVDSSGNLFIADTGYNRIREVTPDGIISTVAGSGVAAFSGDGGPAVSAELRSPWGLALDASGNLFFSDYSNSRIRMVSPSGIITTVAGGGTVMGDGGPATLGYILDPQGIAVDAAGNLFVATGTRIREVSALTGGSQPMNSALQMGVQFKAFAGSTVIRRVAISLH